MLNWLRQLFSKKTTNINLEKPLDVDMISMLVARLKHLIATEQLKNYKCVSTFINRNSHLSLPTYPVTANIENYQAIIGYGFRRFVHDWNFLHCKSKNDSFNQFMIEVSNKQ